MMVEAFRWVCTQKKSALWWNWYSHSFTPAVNLKKALVGPMLSRAACTGWVFQSPTLYQNAWKSPFGVINKFQPWPLKQALWLKHSKQKLHRWAIVPTVPESEHGPMVNTLTAHRFRWLNCNDCCAQKQFCYLALKSPSFKRRVASHKLGCTHKD